MRDYDLLSVIFGDENERKEIEKFLPKRTISSPGDYGYRVGDFIKCTYEFNPPW